MISAHDIYAETNPAFCALVLAKFAGGHFKSAKRGPELICSYLALPLTLSRDLDHSFVSTNDKTGLLVWIDRSPDILVGLAERVNSTLQITTDAVRFGCLSGTLSLADDGRLKHGTTPASITGEAVAQAVKKSSALGCWFGAAGSSRAVMSALGVTL